jgi:hypothetical protein
MGLAGGRRVFIRSRGPFRGRFEFLHRDGRSLGPVLGIIDDAKIMLVIPPA